MLEIKGDDNVDNYVKDVICEQNNRYLCPMRKECLPLLKRWRNEQMDVLRQSQPLTNNDQQKWFKDIENDPSQIVFSLMLQDEQGVMGYIGYCGITNIDYINHRAEMSFLVATPRAQNKMLYRQDFLSSLYMLCWYGFEKIGLNKMFTETFVFREFHVKILEEFGLRLEGRLRKHQLVKGEYYDSLIHALLQDEWPRVKEGVECALGK